VKDLRRNRGISGWLAATAAAYLFLCQPAQGKLQDVEAAQQKSIQSYNQRFSDFTQDKNVMGKAQTATGGQTQAKVKVRFDQDDQVAFESDLTYHDYQYDTEDEAFAQKQAAAPPNANPGDDKTRTLYASVSPHGAIEQGGGSSLLERTVYKLNDQFAKEQSKDEKKKFDEQKGIKYEGVFKVETQEVFNKAQGKNEKDNVPDKVERRELRDEALPQIQKVGEDSFQTIEKAAKDDDKKNDQGAMGTLSFYYGAAKEGLKALYKSTLANLGQVRAYEGIKGAGVSTKVQLSEDISDCDQWQQQAIAQIDPKAAQADKDQQQKEIARMGQQCKQMVKTNYKQVNPQFDGGGGGGTTGADEKLQEKGPKEENDRERDYRVEMNLIGKEGTRAADVPTNWKYKAQDETNKVVTAFDKNGNPTKTENLRMDEQVDRYNDQLKAAAQALPEIQSRFPNLNVTADQINSNQIKHKTKRADEITEYPSGAVVKGFEPDRAKAIGNPKLPENYADLQKAQP